MLPPSGPGSGLQAWVARHSGYLIPVAILIAVWLPGITQGWLRTDSHYYAAIGLDAWQGSLSISPAHGSVAHLLDLRLGEMPYHNKPPLAFWIHGLFLQFAPVGASDAWVMLLARMPSLLAAIAACCLWVRAVTMLAGSRLGLITGIVLAVTVEFFRYTRAISLDLHLAWTIALTFMLAAQAMRHQQPKKLVLAGVGIGLGLLVKPGVALLLVPAIAMWIGWEYGRAMLKRAAWPLALMSLTALCIAAPWYLWMHLEFPGRFIETIAIEQTAERFRASNARPWYYYFALLGETYGPMLVCLIGAIVAWRRGVAAGSARSILRLSIVIGVSWLVIISLASDKHGRYLMPSLMAFAVIAAWWIDIAFIQPRRGDTHQSARVSRRLAWSPAMILAGGIGVAVVTALLKIEVHPPRDPRWERLAQAAELQRITDGDRPSRSVTIADNSAMFPAANFRMMGYAWPRWIGANREHEPAADGMLLSRRGAIEGYQKLPESFGELNLHRRLP